MKVLNCFTKFRWKSIKSESGYVGVCDRLALTTQADTLQELMIMIQDVMSLLFKDLYNDGEWNDYSFKHSIEFRILEDEGFVDVVPSPTYLDEFKVYEK